MLIFKSKLIGEEYRMRYQVKGIRTNG